MTKLVSMAAAVFGLAQLTGCLIVVDDEETSRLEISWQLSGLGVNNMCAELEADTAQIVIYNAGTSTEAIPAESVPCDDKLLVLDGLAPGLYDVYVNLYRGADLVGQSPLEQDVSVNDGETTEVVLDAHGGWFKLAWSIREGGVDSNCTNAGVSKLSVLATPVSGSSTAYDDVFDQGRCDGGSGKTREQPYGNYTVVVSLLDSNEQAISTAPAEAGTLSGQAPEFDLGLYTFDF
jgi:hypothetical protein